MSQKATSFFSLRVVLHLSSSVFMRAISTVNAGTKASRESPVGKQRRKKVKWRKMP